MIISSSFIESLPALCESKSGVEVLLKILSFSGYDYICLIENQLSEITRLVDENCPDLKVQIDKLMKLK